MNPTNWHYVLAGEKRGPVTDAALKRLTAEGTVTDATLVWCEGMPAWKPYVEVRVRRSEIPPAPGETTVLPDATPPGSVRCSQCRRIVGGDDAITLEGASVCAACKPEVLQMLREGIYADSQAERIRKVHLHHEASIKSLGGLQLLGGVLLPVLGIMGGVVVVMFQPGASAGISITDILLLLFLVAIAALNCWLGLGLQRLQNSVRIPSVALAVCSLILFPVGPVIGGYVLWLLLSKKGEVVFSEDYKRIIAETPQMQYRTTWWLWAILGAFVVAVAAAAIYFY